MPAAPDERTIRVEKWKWDGTVSARTPAVLLVAGDAPVWRVPAGSRRERPRRGAVEAVGLEEVSVAAGAWWVATARLAGGRVIAYHVDAALPARLGGDGVLRFCDLDLDLIADAAGVRVRDADVLARRAREMGYPDAVVRGAWAGLADARRRLAAGAWPFDGTLLRTAAIEPAPAGARAAG
jgi:hypothetical protein